MANTLYTATQVAQVAAVFAEQDAYLSALVNRNFENDLLGGGGKNKTVNVRIPSALIARARDIDEVTASIVMDDLVESTFSITLGTHAYSAVPLSEGDLSLRLVDFGRQVLKPQVDAVVDFCENEVTKTLTGLAELNSLAAGAPAAYDAANPKATMVALRKLLRKNGVPQTGLNAIVGTDVYADLLAANSIVDASQSGSTQALREGQIGRIYGFNVVESTRVGAKEIIVFHRDAVTLAVRAPVVPAGASFGASVSQGGFNLRYMRDYNADKTVDRSIVGTFVGAALVPMRTITRNYGASTATIATTPAAYRVDVGTAPVA